jgi:two-component system CheB/CheR fusion protein
VDIDALKHHVGEAQQARAEAENANRAKDLFLANLGHELRTPLSSLLLQAQRLRRSGVLDPARLARIGDSVERATVTQMQLIDDLLDVSRIVAGKLKIDMQAVDLRGIVTAALEATSAAAERKSIELKVALDERVGQVSGDPVRLQQVVSNLLTNAIKFTPERGQVTVTLVAADGKARIEVSDTGMGIGPEFLPQVFNRFSQEDTTSIRRHGGLGLGLAIVRHLVEQHGGTVHAASAGTGKGATFSVTLPLLRASGEVLPGKPVALSGGARAAQNDDERIKDLRILVVDDDLGTREAVVDMLSEMGAEVKGAESAAEAMEAFGEFKPRVVLCDIAMPGEDGYSFIRRVRALGSDAGGDVPAAALTALATADDRRRSLAAGFQMHLTKPVDTQRLTAAVVELSDSRGRPPGRDRSSGRASARS